MSLLPTENPVELISPVREDLVEMSELTFNIADYRPLFRVRTHELHEAKQRGYIVLSSNSNARERETGWLDPSPAVIDIRSIREMHRSVPRRGKVLRFSNPASHRVYTMPAPECDFPGDDDPGPQVA